MAGRDLAQRRALRAAAREGVRATWVEMAARRRVERRWNFALDNLECAAPCLDPRHRGQQRLGVGVVGAGEDLACRRLLDHAAEVHDDHPVGEVLHHAEVVADHDEAEAKLEDEDEDGEEKDFLDFINPDSLEIVGGVIEPSVLRDPVNTRYQFERGGYFWQDQLDSIPEALVFNRIIGLKDSFPQAIFGEGIPQKKPEPAQPVGATGQSPLQPSLELTATEQATLETLKARGINDADSLVLARSTDAEKQSQLQRLADFRQRHAADAPAMLERLQRVAIDGGNVFEVLMDAVRCCSLGQITEALFEVGGQYRRSM